jgi:2',3'-cyclic-nucleotide 2'-phosphodiesterase (5'-nucleotidase family)
VPLLRNYLNRTLPVTALAILVATLLFGPGAAGPDAGRVVAAGHARAPAKVGQGNGFAGALHTVQQEEPTSPRARTPLTLLQINDVYSTVPVDGMGGLARIATVKQQIAASGRTPLLVIAGDFLSPSVASSVFKGEQMVAALNAAGLDMATLGNHEFDFGPDVLLQRMREARWQWIVSNVVDAASGRPIGDALPYVVKTFGPLTVGFIGLCLTSDEITPDRMGMFRLIDPMEAAATYLPILKREGANVIVALTHLTYAQDRALAERFPEIDVIVGGHEHFPITATENRTLISKAGSDGKFIARIDVNRRQSGTIQRFFELMPVTASIPDDPRTLEVVNSYESRLGAGLDAIVGASRVALDAEAVRIRSGETNLGNMVADAMRAEVGADITLANAGGIRGDRVYPAGALSRRTLVTMAPFGNVVCKVALPGRLVLDALNNAVSRMPATDGRFPQISGMTIKVNATAPPGLRISDVTVGGQPLDPDRVYTVAMSDYQLKGGDGYDMFAKGRVIVGPEDGPLVMTAIEKYITARVEVNPSVEGRITVVR